MRDQEAAVQRTVHFVKSSFFHLSALIVKGLNVVLTSLYFGHRCTNPRPQLLRAGSEATPPRKPSIRNQRIS